MRRGLDVGRQREQGLEVYFEIYWCWVMKKSDGDEKSDEKSGENSDEWYQ